jgi:hypothetical protein
MLLFPRKYYALQRVGQPIEAGETPSLLPRNASPVREKRILETRGRMSSRLPYVVPTPHLPPPNRWTYWTSAPVIIGNVADAARADRSYSGSPADAVRSILVGQRGIKPGCDNWDGGATRAQKIVTKSPWKTGSGACRSPESREGMETIKSLPQRCQTFNPFQSNCKTLPERKHILLDHCLPKRGSLHYKITPSDWSLALQQR